MEQVLSDGESLGLAWVVILSFLRITTRPGLLARPLPVKTAFDLVDEWLDQPSCFIIQPGQHHASILRKLLVQSDARGNLTTDAHLAALAIEHDAEIASFDRDFRRFPGLRWRDPSKLA